MFNHLGVIRVEKEQLEEKKVNKDEFEMGLMDAGVEDIIDSEMGLEVRCALEKFQQTLEVVKK